MNIVLCKTSDDRRVVSKKINNVITLENIIVKENTSLFNPTFIIRGFNIEQIPSFNYVRFPKAGRYYFVNDIRMTNGKGIEINCTCDVLHTFRKDIRSWSPIVSRQQTLVNNEIPDSLLPLYSKQIISHKNIGTLPTGASLVLTTTGRSGSNGNEIL